MKDGSRKGHIYMEVKEWTYEDYPEYHTAISEAEVLDTTGDEIFVSYTPDVPYAVMDGQTLTLQILSPETRNNPDRLYPVILYVQGSHWDKQNIYRAVPELSKLAARGYVTAIVEYRGYDRAYFPAPLVDARNAVRFMKLHAREYHGDPDKIFLSGNSSGGHTALYAEIFDGEDRNQYPGISPDVSGIIDFYGSVSVMEDDSNPSTMNHCLPDSPEGMEMGRVNLRNHPELKEKLSVECNISRDTQIPPVLIIHGTKDRTVNPRCSEILYRKLKECGKDAEIVFLRGADHGGGEFWSEQVLKIIDRFTKRVRR